jgi:hypothetical protein
MHLAFSAMPHRILDALRWDVDHAGVAADVVGTGCHRRLTQDIQAQRMDVVDV